MTVQTTAGMTLALSAAAPATYDDAGFEALTYTEVSEVSDFGEAEASAEEVTHTPVKTGIINKLKGSINYGNLNVQFARVASDAGQQIVKNGFDGPARNTIHSARLTDQNGDKIYFTVRIMSNGLNIGGPNQIFGGNTNLAVLGGFIPVAA